MTSHSPTTIPVTSRPAGRPSSLLVRAVRQAGYEAKTILGNGEQLLLALVLPVLALVALTWVDVLDGVAPRRIDAATPGVLALALVSVAFTGQAIQTGFDRQYGVLRSLSTTPLGRGGLILGKTIAVFAVLLVQLVVLGIIAAAMGWHPNLGGILPALIGLVLGVAAFASLGLLIAGTMRPQATLAVTNLLWALLAAVGGLLLPVGRLDGVAHSVVSLLPSSALAETLRAALLQGRFDLASMLVLAIWAVVGSVAAIRWFLWD
ncbi:MAG: ABC transporter permease [Galactobacter sp.]